MKAPAWLLVPFVLCSATKSESQISQSSIERKKNAAFPETEWAELLAAAGLKPGKESGYLLRYTLKRGYYGRNLQTAMVAEANWSSSDQPASITLVELARPRDGWVVRSRKGALIHPNALDTLTRNVIGAASVIQDRGDWGSVVVCSHSPSSRLDIHIAGDVGYSLVRASPTCSRDDAPAVVAGNLLTKFIEQGIESDWKPD